MPNGKSPRDLKISGGNILLDPYFILEQIGLRAGMKIADLGCGAAGHFVIPAAKIVGEKGKIYAVDLLKSVLEAVKSRAKLEGVGGDVELVWSDLEIYGATKIQSNSLDLILLANILWQVKKREEVLKEAIRLLKKDGKLAVVEWGAGEAPLGPPPETRIGKDFIIDLAKKYNLKVVKEFKAGPYHYGLVFMK